MRLVSVTAWLIGTVGFLLLIPNSVAAQQVAAPSVQEILNKAIDRAKWDQDQNFPAKYTYTEHETTEKFYSSGGTREKEDKVFQVFPIGAYPYRRLIEKNGRPLTGPELQQEQERERKFRQRIGQGKKPKKDEDEFDVKFNRELADRYDYEFAGEETLNGRPAYILAFKPRSANLPVTGRIDKILNKLEGQLWIDTQDYEIAKADVQMTGGPTSFGLVLAVIRGLHVVFQQTKVDEAWMPSLVRDSLQGRVLFSSLDRKDVDQSTNFRRVAPVLGQAHPVPVRP